MLNKLKEKKYSQSDGLTYSKLLFLLNLNLSIHFLEIEIILACIFEVLNFLVVEFFLQLF